MRRSNRVFLAVLALLLLLPFWSRTAGGQTLAVFPLLDLTIGPNGINTVLTEHIRRETEARGFELIPEEDIMRFMILHRIRSMGRLTSHQIAVAGEKLGADLVLQGTVCQLRGEPAPTVSLSLQLLRTSDQTPIWAHTEGLYYAELLTLLGLSDPENMDDLYRVFFSRLLEDMPGRTMHGKTEGDIPDIETVVLRPDYVRPGEIIDCRIRFYSIPSDPESLSLIARVNDEEYPLALDADKFYFAASWPAQEREGEYTVTLVETWPTGQSRSGVIGTYFVDNREPEVVLHVRGKDLDGRTAFSRELIMAPQLIDPEPINRWEIQAINREGEVIVHQGVSGHIPQQITWRGQTSKGTIAPDGEYKIVFRVWDRTGRESATETEVSFLRMPPDISIQVSRVNGSVLVDLKNSGTTPVAYWWMKLFDANGRQLELVEGEVLPAVIQLEIPEAEDESENILEGLLHVSDVMANQTTMVIKNLLQLEKEEETEEINLEVEWVEEF
ncbi:MAG: hypothetical protein SCH71_06250 [Desulfobulbaceae bacterium]|nr:hypothetical protein [Desulfobulbaceae bacterium]